jgi:teichuronic acid biosynthesis glycosyltransferase TuaG
MSARFQQMSERMDNPHISIVIPTYNHAGFLRTAIDSIRVQTFADWEALIVNNFSEDDTIVVVESYDDPRIKLVNFANHGIIAAARNHGLSLTRAPLVAFLDSDDFWYPEKLQRCIDKVAQGYDLVCHAEAWVGPGERRHNAHYGRKARATYEGLLLDGNCISTSAVMVRREWLERAGGFSIQPDFVTAEDYELWLKLARDGAKIGFIDEVLGEYLIHEHNNSRDPLRNMHAVMAVCEHHFSEIQPNMPPWRTHRRRASILYSGARALQKGGEHRQAIRLFLRAILKWPWILKFYVAMLMSLVHIRC